MENIKKRICTRFSNSGATKITLVFLTDENISLKIDEISEKGNFKHLRGERTSKDVLPTKEEIKKFITYSMSVNKKNEEENIKREKEEKARVEKENLFLSKKIIKGEDKEYKDIKNNLFYSLAESYSHNVIDAAVIVLYSLGEIELNRIDEDTYRGRDFGHKEIILEIKNGFLCNKIENKDNTDEYFIILNGIVKFKIIADDKRLKGKYSRDYLEIDSSDFDFIIERI